MTSGFVSALTSGFDFWLWLRLGFRLWLSFGFRLRLGLSLVFLNLLLRLLPILNCVTALAASLLIEFIGSLRDLRRQIGWWHSFGFRLWFNLGVSLWLVFSFGLRQGFGLRFRFGLDGIKNLIGEQFHAVIHEEPNEGVSPNETLPSASRAVS